jgi:hypothetical protein
MQFGQHILLKLKNILTFLLPTVAQYKFILVVDYFSTINIRQISRSTYSIWYSYSEKYKLIFYVA